MSFFSNLFSKDSEEKVKEKEKSKKSKEFNIEKNFKNSIAIELGYNLVKEIDLKQQGFLKGEKLDYTKLNEDFKDKVVKFLRTNFKDYFRPKNSNKKGGIDFNNKEITSLLRSMAGDIIGQIGKKIFSGDFNLTTISFPIKVMLPITILQAIARTLFQYPYYLELAKEKDIIEKFKYSIVASISSFYCSTLFLKPMNPVIGETYEAAYSDGSLIYLEQTSHHPPISHYEIRGPNKCFYVSGYSTFKSSAGINSLTVINKGKRKIQFKDGQTIIFNPCKVNF